MKRDRDWFLNELRRLPFTAGLRAITDQDAWVRCPFHGGGRERTGSLRVQLKPNQYGPEGRFYCFGCGAGGKDHKIEGDWNTLAKALGMTKIKGFAHDSYVHETSAAEQDELFGGSRLRCDNPAASIDSTDLSNGIPWDRTETWRGINGKLVHRLGGTMVPREFYGGIETSLYLPLRMFDEPVGGVYCQIVKTDDAKSYIYTPETKLKKTLFPWDWIVEHYDRRQPLWLVEGPRDALNVIQAGGYAIANLGAYTALSERKMALITGLDPSRLLLAFDGDAPGRKATRISREYFQARLDYKILRFPPPERQADGTVKKIDPGALKRAPIRRIIKHYRIPRRRALPAK